VGEAAAGEGAGLGDGATLLCVVVLAWLYVGVAAGGGVSVSLPSGLMAAAEPSNSDRNEPPPSAVEDAAPDPATSALMLLCLWAVLVSDSTLMGHQIPLRTNSWAFNANPGPVSGSQETL
jgi:hypothetical protein